MTRDLYNLDLLAELMVFLRQILLHLAAIAAISQAILVRIAAETDKQAVEMKECNERNEKT